MVLFYDFKTGRHNYEFNYTGDSPKFGKGGCLRIIGNTVGDFGMILTQKITLEAGKVYRLDAAVKTRSTHKDFNTQIFVSPQQPVDGENYKATGEPNNGIYLSLSTWQGCGRGVDGWISDLSCQGNGILYEVSWTKRAKSLIYITQ